MRRLASHDDEVYRLLFDGDIEYRYARDDLQLANPRRWEELNRAGIESRRRNLFRVYSEGW